MDELRLFSEPTDKRELVPHDVNFPLAARMRPRTLEEFVGQGHLLGEGQLLERLIRSDSFQSLIFFGPPGTGKTTLAHVIAHETKRRFVNLSAVTSHVQEVRQVIDSAKLMLRQGSRTIVFVDEIHRFNKAQQDILLPHIENGVISFIGATTMNPFFAIVAPLVSRSQIFRLKVLSEAEVLRILKGAIDDKERGLGHEPLAIEEGVLDRLAVFSQGDARRALNVLDSLHSSAKPDEKGERHLMLKDVTEALEERPVQYDRNQDEHYDTISAFIKSVRGSDPDAALYWLAKMLHGGEDILFIARRLMILASEDIGNADPQAIQVAAACLQSVQFVGLPEARIPLSQVTIYLALAPKSNSAYRAIDGALESIRQERIQRVPSHLKNVKAEDERDAFYQYPHDFEGHQVEQQYLNQERTFLQLSDQGFENDLNRRWKAWRESKKN